MFFRTLLAKAHEVTWYSRLGAIIIFLGALPLFCLYVGWELAILNQTTYSPSQLTPAESKIELSKGMSYETARGTLLKAGWQVPELPTYGYASTSQKVISECSGNTTFCNKYPEINACSMDGYCLMTFNDAQGHVLHVTILNYGAPLTVTSWKRLEADDRPDRYNIRGELINHTSKTAFSPQLSALNEKLLAEGACARNPEAPSGTTSRRDDYAGYEKTFLNNESGMSFDAFITKDMPVRVEVACDYNHIVITGAIEQVLEGPNPHVDTRVEELRQPLVSSEKGGAVSLEEDYNFDGYNDLRSVYYPFAHGEHAYFFLFDEKTMQFIQNNDLSELYSPYIGPGTIESSSFSGGGASIKKMIYKWSSEGVLEKMYDYECNTEYHASTSAITIGVRHYRGNKPIGEIQHEENGECP